MGTSWFDAYETIRLRVERDPQFLALVRGYGGDPNSKPPTQRAKRLADRICERLGLSPAIYRGNVFGAAAQAIRERRVTPR